MPEAYRLIAECEERYPSSSLFLFFKGRAQRLESRLDEGLTTYRDALKACDGQREIQLICYHEIGKLLVDGKVLLVNF